MRVARTVRRRARLPGLALLVTCGLTVVGCASEQSGGPGVDCTSSYTPVARGDTWAELRAAMLRYDDRGRVASLREQARGEDVGVGDQRAVRIVDLLGSGGRRLAQVEVWRTDDGGWRAGSWSQCID